MNSGPLQAYYKAAYAAVRKHSSSCFVAIAPRVYEQDGSEWQHFMAGSGYTNVLQDLHRCALPGLLTDVAAALWPRPASAGNGTSSPVASCMACTLHLLSTPSTEQHQPECCTIWPASISLTDQQLAGIDCSAYTT